MSKQSKTCHLCCLLAFKCFDQLQSINYLTTQHANKQNNNAMFSSSSSLSLNIWKTNVDKNKDVSPLHDIPLCFHKDFSSDKKGLITETFPSKNQSYPIQVCVIEFSLNYFFFNFD